MSKKFISTLLLTGLICMASLAQADTVREVYRFKATTAEDKHRVSLGNMKNAIYEAADDEDWDARMLGKQKIELTKNDDDEFARLVVDYTAQDFKIRLVESRGFGFDERTRRIDSKFTSWMNELVENIQEDLRDSKVDDIRAN